MYGTAAECVTSEFSLLHLKKQIYTIFVSVRLVVYTCNGLQIATLLCKLIADKNTNTKIFLLKTTKLKSNACAYFGNFNVFFILIL